MAKMKLSIAGLNGSCYEVQASPNDTIRDLKNTMELKLGRSVCHAEHTLLLEGKVLEDHTTLKHNKISEHSFLMIMTKRAFSSAESASRSPKPVAPSETLAPATILSAPTNKSAPAPVVSESNAAKIAYGQEASNHVAGSNSEATVVSICDIGGGNLDRDVVLHALYDAYSSVKKAVENAGIPRQALNAPNEAPQATQAAASSSGSNAHLLDLPPQSMFQDFGQHISHALRLIQEIREDFAHFMNDPADAIQVEELINQKDRVAINRLVAMGFDGLLVLHVFFACNKNEEMAAAFLFDHVWR